jgi:hypothetical protein
MLYWESSPTHVEKPLHYNPIDSNSKGSVSTGTRTTHYALFSTTKNATRNRRGVQETAVNSGRKDDVATDPRGPILATSAARFLRASS